MDAFDAITIQPVGATFYRGDLHIHSYGASHDVADVNMTPEAIVRAAIQEDLHVIAIADHNDIRNVSAALKAAENSQLLVIPAVELSTPQGHLLCYFSDFPALQRFFGKLPIADSGSPNSRCQYSMLECLNHAQDVGGICLLAHVDAPSGFEFENPGASPHKADVLSHSSLVGIELKSAASAVCYAPNDADGVRKGLGEERVRRLQLGSKQYLARVLSSDAHTLISLGRNAGNDRKVTRFKMDKPSFEALKIALENADARVRIEEQVPAAIPKVVGLQFEGGFLSGQCIQFSQNLNCIVGGRGTGKSTAFESVRTLVAGDGDTSPVIDSEVWPEELFLIWRDKAGQLQKLRRLKGEDIENLDAPDVGPTSFDIDCFGQGDAAKISLQAQSDPLALLLYLDRFIPLARALGEEITVRDELLQLQTEIESAEQKVDQIPQFESLLNVAKSQLTALQKPEVKELIDLQRQLSSEREIRNQIDVLVGEAKEGATLSSRNAAKGIRELADPKELTVGRVEFQAIAQGATTFDAALAAAEMGVKSSMLDFELIVKAQVAQWKVKESSAQVKIDAKKRELEALRVSFDMSYIAKLAKDEASHQQTLKNLKTWMPHLEELRKKRQAAVTRRWQAREKVAGLRSAFGRTASVILKEELSDLNVSLKYASSAHSPAAVDLIIQTMGWRTNQQPRALPLVRDLGIHQLLQAISKKDSRPILEIKTPENVPVFNSIEAAAILDKMSTPAVRFALERVEIHDLPRLQVTKRVVDALGSERYVTRDFARLSLGQKQSVLLALILSADTDRPLIIDQPEDNLDGEFIFSTLVPVLRRAKERRQVIIVTHNANVAVLGDAEQIIVMKAANDRGEIVARGSIDHADTRDVACAILEGAREAFLRRAKMYGVLLR
ncbi:TrlF family AAA-like ATPase [Polaromonas sp.]|uniref:TrlF family AAA-like ATPase n=1 Tax=Polaromonas sp. TaxID=1869339 RepID=UPI002487B360|nr:AAA family ATPase [Polaromonas sp.]MDI1338986.1 AAA family ATPase [Polaromonas sp.]